jgi:hypothetical protein
MCFTACSSYSCTKDHLSSAESGQKLENFFCLILSILHMWPTFVFNVWQIFPDGVDSASNRNEYQEYFLGGKGGWCVGLTTLPPSCADCLEILGASKSWNQSGPIQGSFVWVWRVCVYLYVVILTSSELAPIHTYSYSVTPNRKVKIYVYYFQSTFFVYISILSW